jgi:redox-sensitive bicupin YhaK (pirin superfamily)
MLEGAVEHGDNRGNHGVLGPGDVQWMTAGAGVLHKEFHEENFSKKGGPFEMVQLWVNLPKKDKSVSAHYQGITKEEIATVDLPDNAGIVNVIAGDFNGTKGAAKTFTPVNLFDIKLKEGGQTAFSLPETFNTAILVINGSAVINEEKVKEHSFVLFKNDGEGISIKALENTVLLVMSGEPIDEPIASYGPFVMNTQQEILEAINDFQNGKFGYLD